MRRKTQLAGLATLAAGLLALSPALASANTSAVPGAIAFPGSTEVGKASAPLPVVVNVDCTTVIPVPAPFCAVPGLFQPNLSTTGDFAIVTNGCGTGVVTGNLPFAPVPCPVIVAFKPKSAGLRTGTLTLGDDLTGTDPGTVGLTGAGVPASSSGGSGTTGTKKKCKPKKRFAQSAKKKCKKK
jgi:hypothetical protein